MQGTLFRVAQYAGIARCSAIAGPVPLHPVEDQIEGEDPSSFWLALKRCEGLFERRNTDARTLWGRLPLLSLSLGALGGAIFVAVLLTHTRHGSLDHMSVAGWLLALGGFCLVGSFAMWARTEVAESYGRPDPYAPPGYPPDRISWWGRLELRNVRLYRGVAWFFAVIGSLLLVASCLAQVVSFLG